MVRLLTLSGLFLLLAAPTASAGVREKILRECQDGRITGDYTPAQLRDARKNIPTDIDEYSDCRDVLARAALAGRATAAAGTVAPAAAGPRRARRRPARRRQRRAHRRQRPGRGEGRSSTRSRRHRAAPTSRGEHLVPGASGLAADAARHGLPTLAAHRPDPARPLRAGRRGPGRAPTCHRSPAALSPPRRSRLGAVALTARRAPTRRDRGRRRSCSPRSRSPPTAACARAHDLDRGRPDPRRRRAGRLAALLTGRMARATARRADAARVRRARRLHRALDHLVGRPRRLVARGQPHLRLRRGVRRRARVRAASRPAAGRRSSTASRSPACSCADGRC